MSTDDKTPLLVRYLGVGRLSGSADTSDNVILASHSTSEDIEDASLYAKWFRGMMATSSAVLRENLGLRFHKISPEDDDTAKSGLHLNWLASPLSDEKTDAPVLVYFAVCAALYPERTPLHGPAHLLWELRANISKTVGGLLATASEADTRVTGKAAPVMASLAWLHGMDKFTAVDDAVSRVKEQMHANLVVALDNADQLQAIDAKAEELAEWAKAWNLGTKKVAQQMCWKKWKTQILLACILVVLLVVIIAPIVGVTSSGPPSPDDGN